MSKSSEASYEAEQERMRIAHEEAEQGLVKCDECKKYFTAETKYQYCCDSCEAEGEAHSDELRGN